MLLNLLNIKTYEKAIKAACVKTDNAQKNSLYFDFERKEIMLHNNFFIGKLPFDFTVDSEDEEYINAYFNIQKLFTILNECGYMIRLEFENKRPVFKKDKDRFLIENMIATTSYKFDFDSAEHSKYTTTEVTKRYITEAQHFTADDLTNFNSVILQDNMILSNCDFRLYLAKTDDHFDDEIILHKDLIKVLSSIEETDIPIFYCEEITTIVLENFTLSFSNENNVFSAPQESDLTQVIEQVQVCSLKKEDLLAFFRFIPSFYDDSTATKAINITIIDAETIQLSNISDIDLIKKTIPATCSEELIGFSTNYELATLRNIIAFIDEDNIQVYLSEDVIGATFIGEGSTNKKMVVIETI